MFVTPVVAGSSAFPYAGFSKLLPSVSTMDTDMEGTSHCTGGHGHYLSMISETPSGGMATSAMVPPPKSTRPYCQLKVPTTEGCSQCEKCMNYLDRWVKQRDQYCDCQQILFDSCHKSSMALCVTTHQSRIWLFFHSNCV